MYDRYRSLRDSKRLKDSAIANELGITPSTFSDWKKGKSQPNVDKLVKIARYLGTSVEYLVTGEDPVPGVKLSSDEDSLLSAYRSLNTLGREKAAEYVSDLAGIDRYIKEVQSSAG